MQWWVSADNVIPEKTARWFLGEPFISGVYTFDRGPLQPLLLLWGGEWSTNPTPALITGVIVNSAWAIGLWSLLRVLRISEQRIAFVIVLVALTGPVWFNTLYVWPKMLAAALCLGCAAAVLSRRPLWAGVLAGLALLAHGTALFAIVGLLPWMVMKFRWKTIAVLGIASLFYAPWYVASLFVASTGQPQMIQWHFGGTDFGTPDLRSPLPSVIDSYRQAGLAAIGNKINNFRVLLGDPLIFRQEGGHRWQDVGWPGQSGWLGQARWLMSSHLALAPGVLLGGLFWARGISRTLWMLAGAWFLVYGILEWGGERNRRFLPAHSTVCPADRVGDHLRASCSGMVSGGPDRILRAGMVDGTSRVAVLNGPGTGGAPSDMGAASRCHSAPTSETRLPT